MSPTNMKRVVIRLKVNSSKLKSSPMATEPQGKRPRKYCKGKRPAIPKIFRPLGGFSENDFKIGRFRFYPRIILKLRNPATRTVEVATIRARWIRVHR